MLGQAVISVTMTNSSQSLVFGAQYLYIEGLHVSHLFGLSWTVRLLCRKGAWLYHLFKRLESETLGDMFRISLAMSVDRRDTEYMNPSLARSKALPIMRNVVTVGSSYLLGSYFFLRPPNRCIWFSKELLFVGKLRYWSSRIVTTNFGTIESVTAGVTYRFLCRQKTWR